MTFKFIVHQRDIKSHARLGTLTTPHGDIQTPAFIFCATKASVKNVPPEALVEAGTQIILSNTYHLMLQPGSEVVAMHGGLHAFMNWSGPMLTDSGGFQIFSLGHGSVAQEIKGKRQGTGARSLMKITEEGAHFRSYINGQKYVLTPERSIAIQQALGADLIVVLDECTPFHVSKAYTEESMALSHRWATRSLEAFQKGDTDRQRLYGIIQGGVYEDLRKMSCDYVNQQPFFGHAIGGSLGADKSQMFDVVSYTMSELDLSRPVHLLGIGGIIDIFKGVHCGIDTFDCVHPTRLARHGGALIQGGIEGKEHLNVKRGIYKTDLTPLDSQCSCYTCRHYTKSYLHHLFKAGELLALQLLSIHNITYMNRLLEDIREAIQSSTLDDCQKKWLAS